MRNWLTCPNPQVDRAGYGAIGMTPVEAVWGTRLSRRLMLFWGRVRPSRWRDPSWLERMPIVCERSGLVWTGVGLRLGRNGPAKEPVPYLALGWLSKRAVSDGGTAATGSPPGAPARRGRRPQLSRS